MTNCSGSLSPCSGSGTPRHRGGGGDNKEKWGNSLQRCRLGEERGRNYGICLDHPPTRQYTEKKHSIHYESSSRTLVKVDIANYLDLLHLFRPKFKKIKTNFKKIKSNFKKIKANFKNVKSNFKNIKSNFKKIKTNFKKDKIGRSDRKL